MNHCYPLYPHLRLEYQNVTFWILFFTQLFGVWCDRYGTGYGDAYDEPGRRTRSTASSHRDQATEHRTTAVCRQNAGQDRTAPGEGLYQAKCLLLSCLLRKLLDYSMCLKFQPFSWLTVTIITYFWSLFIESSVVLCLYLYHHLLKKI